MEPFSVSLNDATLTLKSDKGVEHRKVTVESITDVPGSVDHPSRVMLNLIVGDKVSHVPAMPAQQEWVTRLSIMMQSVLLAAVRAPDGLRKDHPVKVIMRWYRRSILLSAFDGAPILDPFVSGGGSFTGPFEAFHFWSFIAPHRPWLQVAKDWEKFSLGRRWQALSEMRLVYLRHVDEMPHHFQLHMMHAAQIVGTYHPSEKIREWWWEFYLMIVNDAHLVPETRVDLIERLSDNEQAWRRRENTPAK